MQKKMLAVAVAGALGAPALAFAQAPAGTSTVQVFGTIYGEWIYYKNEPSSATPGGGAAAPTDRVNFDYFRTAGSEIGFKGEEQLGGGLAAWFQCASTADFRGTTANGWCSRNSGLGFKGFFGNVWGGIWDSPYKRAYAIGNVASGETGAFGNSPVLHNGTAAFQFAGGGQALSTAAAGQNRGGWTQRTPNSIFYDSPNFAGFQVNGMIQIANLSTAVTNNNSNKKPRAWALSGTYSAGPLGVGLFYEKHEDAGLSSVTATGVAQTMDDRSYGISAAYTFGPVKVGGVWKREKYDVPNGPAGASTSIGSQKLSAWHVGVDWNIAGPHGLRVGYTRAGDIKGTCISTNPGCVGSAGVTAFVPATGYSPGIGVRPDAGSGTGATFMQIKYVFAFSKRTELQAGYSKISNKNNAGYNYSDIGGNVQAGKDPSAWAMTVQHKF